MIDFFSRLDTFMKINNLNDNKITVEAGLANGIIGKARKRGSLSQDNIAKILHTYPLDANWLFNGFGDMIRESNTDEPNMVSDSRSNYKFPDKSHKKEKRIPLIPIEAIAGFGSGEMQVMDYDTDTYVVPEFNELNVEFMIRIKGSSMYPKYSSGDIVGCKKLPLDTFFQWNKVYVIDTIQGPIIKRVHESNKEDCIICVSENEKYTPFNLKKSEIYSLAIVLGVIRLE